MLTKLIKFQLVVFTIIAVLAVGYSAYSYAGLQRYSGIGTYTVKAQLPEAGGLYANSLVTYRGVDVGVVTAMDLAPEGAVAVMQIKSDHKVPANTSAHVRSVSAVGEQFIDLVPEQSGGPFLADGDVIKQDRASIPYPATEVITKVNALLQTLPKEALRTTVDEASQALNQTGPEVNKALTASAELVRNANKNLEPTLGLIDSARPVLSALADSGTEIATFSSNLSSFTNQLAMSDGSIRLALDTGTPFFDTVSGAFQDLTPVLPILLSNLQTVGEVLRVNVPGLQHILVVYPALTSAVNAMHQGFQDPNDNMTGQGALDVKLGNTANPLPCTEGYGETQRRDPSDLSSAPAPENAYCKLPKDDYRVVRGARNLPCATDPSVRTADVAKCPEGLPSQWPQMLSRPGTGNQPVAVDPKTPVAVPYDPATGRFRTPAGATYTIGSLASKTSDTKEKTSWQQLFPE